MSNYANFKPLMIEAKAVPMTEVYGIITKMNKKRITLKRISGTKTVTINGKDHVVDVWRHFSVPRATSYIVKAGYGDELSQIAMPCYLSADIGIWNTNI